MKKIMFISGTRADYGKLKPLISTMEQSGGFETHVFITGMHLSPEQGYTAETVKNNHSNVHIADNITAANEASLVLSESIREIGRCVSDIKPDLLIVHGDRVEPMAGALVGALHNIRVAHIEGGEVSGTIDESLRHAISKLSHLHFVSNNEARLRLLQLGESGSSIFVIGSPDIDIMLGSGLPLIEDVKRLCAIPFTRYAISILHPVTTEPDGWRQRVDDYFSALEKSGRNYIVIYPNNDYGSDIIIDRIKRLPDNFLAFQSLMFEYFLTLLKNAEFIIGNSSAGVREACVYGVPAIDVGSRQNNRYSLNVLRNIQHTDGGIQEVLRCIGMAEKHRIKSLYFGEGNSAELFKKYLCEALDNEGTVQKKFHELPQISSAIERYINSAGI